MKRLTLNQIENYRQTIIKDWRTHQLHSIKARVEFPLGEITDSLAGFAWAWKMKNEMPEIQPITASDSFDAQGLEGKMVKYTDLATAVTIWSQCRVNRCQIFTADND